MSAHVLCFPIQFNYLIPLWQADVDLCEMKSQRCSCQERLCILCVCCMYCTWNNSENMPRIGQIILFWKADSYGMHYFFFLLDCWDSKICPVNETSGLITHKRTFTSYCFIYYLLLDITKLQVIILCKNTANLTVSILSMLLT